MLSSTSDKTENLPLQISDSKKRQKTQAEEDLIVSLFLGIFIAIFLAFGLFIVIGRDNKNSNESFKTPKVYNFAQVRSGALVENGCNRTRISADKFEAAILIVFESIKIHTYPDKREWFDMCERIYLDLDKTFGGKWNCIASDKPILSWVRITDSYLKDVFCNI